MQMMKMKRATIVAATSEPKYVIPEYISYINLDQSVPNIEEVITRLMVTMAMTKKLMEKICFIPFAELSILDVVFAFCIPWCCAILWRQSFIDILEVL